MKNTSKKKRYTKKYRLGASTNWISNYKGKEAITEEYEHKIRQIEAAKKITRQKNKENRAKNKLKRQAEFSDDNFAFIVGYTSGGAAYGVTHEEMEIQLQEEKVEKIDIDEIFKI